MKSRPQRERARFAIDAPAAGERIVDRGDMTVLVEHEEPRIERVEDVLEELPFRFRGFSARHCEISARGGAS